MVMLAHQSVLEPCQEAITEYRVLGPVINGCSWIELRPLTSRKHQVSCHILFVCLTHTWGSAHPSQVNIKCHRPILSLTVRLGIELISDDL